MRLRRRKPTEPEPQSQPQPQPDTRAHIVWPASKLAAAKRGEPVQARCGAAITGDAIPDAPICQECVVAQLEVDDQASSEQASQRFGEGQQSGRRQYADELRVAAAAKAQREREQLEVPRFELIDNDRAVKFTFDDGTTATMRRDRVGSVALESQSGVHRVAVDGRVLIAHSDLDLVRRHHDRVHDAVFGERVPAAQQAGG